MTNKWLGISYALLAGLFFGFIGYFGMSILRDGVSVPNMLFWRFFIAGLIISMIVLFGLKKSLDFGTLKSFVVAAVFYSGSTSLYFLSSIYIGTGLAVVILFTFPAFVMLLSWLLYKQKVRKVYYVSVVLILLGLSLLSYSTEVTIDILGIFLAIGSAIFYALYIVTSKTQTKDTHPLLLTLTVCAGCSIVFLSVALFHGSFKVPQTINLWANIIGIAVICTILPILWTLYGLKYISASKTSILAVLEPVIVVIVGVIFLEETITIKQILGISIILIAAILVQLDSFHVFNGKNTKIGKS